MTRSEVGGETKNRRAAVVSVPERSVALAGRLEGREVSRKEATRPAAERAPPACCCWRWEGWEGDRRRPCKSSTWPRPRGDAVLGRGMGGKGEGDKGESPGADGPCLTRSCGSGRGWICRDAGYDCSTRLADHTTRSSSLDEPPANPPPSHLHIRPIPRPCRRRHLARTTIQSLRHACRC